MAWIQQADLSQSIQGASGDATVEELTAMGLTVDQVQPQTCAVCHDTHHLGNTSGEPNNAILRIEDNTPMLPAGFQAEGVGRGALCMVCHNTRNGAHNDQVTTNADDRAPHTAAQADVLMGENAYFVAVGQRSKHSLISDTCANCHMEQSPPPAEFSMNGAGTNHSFEASTEICSNCHGAFDGEALINLTETKMEALKAGLEQAILAEINAQTGKGRAVKLVGFGEGGADVDIKDGATVTAVELTESHGRMAMNVTVGDQTYENVRLGSDTAVGSGSLLSSEAGQAIAKAGWNYFLIEGDSSKGVHNPTFVLDVIDASLKALQQ
jgi:ribosomal protein L31